MEKSKAVAAHDKQGYGATTPAHKSIESLPPVHYRGTADNNRRGKYLATCENGRVIKNDE